MRRVTSYASTTSRRSMEDLWASDASEIAASERNDLRVDAYCYESHGEVLSIHEID